MALTVDFDSPQAASGRNVTFTVTVPAGETFLAAIELLVTRSDDSTDSYYLTRQYDNSAGTQASVISSSVQIVIIPALTGTESATAIGYGALIGPVDES